MQDSIDLGIDGLDDGVEIGTGGYGSVFRALQRDVGRTVAVRVFPVRPEPALRDRYTRECEILRALSVHPNIVTMYAAGFTMVDQPFMVMEYMPNGSLADRVERDGRIPWAEAVTIIATLADALAVAHAARILHRDIRPKNVLISSMGDPCLADLGLARVLDVVESRTAPVSLGHAAPEVVEGRRPTEASDVYSLGSTLFELLAGSPAFVGSGTDDQMSALLGRIAKAPVPDLRRRGVPDAVCDVLESAMAKPPASRPESASVLGERLRAALDPRLATRPVTPVAPAPPVIPPRPIVAAEVTAVVPQPVPAPIPDPEPEPEPLPVPEPDPAPVPVPDPEPAPIPEPSPGPVPAPPNPPLPDPELAPEPTPPQALEPEPAPTPDPAPDPDSRLFATRTTGGSIPASDAVETPDGADESEPALPDPAPVGALTIPSLPIGPEPPVASTSRVFEGEPDEASRSRGRLVRFGLGALVALISLVVLVLILVDSSRSKVGTPTASVSPPPSSSSTTTTTATTRVPGSEPLVFAPVTMPSGLQVARTWRITGDNGNQFTAAVVVTNPTAASITDSVVEVIPKILTTNVANVKFVGAQPTVLNPDPVVQYDVIVAPGARQQFGYTVPVQAQGIGTERLELWKTARDNEQKAIDSLFVQR